MSSPPELGHLGIENEELGDPGTWGAVRGTVRSVPQI